MHYLGAKIFLYIFMNFLYAIMGLRTCDAVWCQLCQLQTVNFFLRTKSHKKNSSRTI